MLDCEQRSDEWYAARRGIVTASMVGQLITAKTMKPADNDTSRAVVAELVAERILGFSEDNYVNDDMMRGILDEPMALDVYAKHYAPVTTTGFMVRREDGWTLGYSPDGLVGDDGLVEVKCPRAKTHLRTILEDRMPPRHMAQVQAGLLVSGRQWCDFVSYYAGLPLYVARVLPDPLMQSAIRDACRLYEDQAQGMLAIYAEMADALPKTERMDVVI
jgi:putative phage-type endonuclease